MQSEAEVSKEFFVVVVGWNRFTDCSTMSLKAFNFRPYFAANHNGGHLISCSVPSSVISDFVYKKGLLWSRLGSIDNQCFMDTAFQIAQQRFYKKWSDRMYCTAIFYIVLLIWSVLYSNYWFTYSLKGFFASSSWGPECLVETFSAVYGCVFIFSATRDWMLGLISSQYHSLSLTKQLKLILMFWCIKTVD